MSTRIESNESEQRRQSSSKGEYSNRMVLPNPYSEYSCAFTFFRLSHRSSSNRKNSSNLTRHLYIAYRSRISKRGLFLFPLHRACVELIAWEHTGDTAVLNVELKCLPMHLHIYICHMCRQHCTDFNRIHKMLTC